MHWAGWALFGLVATTALTAVMITVQLAALTRLDLPLVLGTLVTADDAAWVLVQAGHRLYSETWRAVRGFADLVAHRWHEPDAGIWEIREDAAQHVPSKLMAWLALDRALRIADTHRLRARQRRRWQTAPDAIAAEARARGFDPAKGSCTRSYGSDDLDAALLVLPLLGIEDADSARVRGTIDAIRAELSAGGPLLYRYPPGRDGLPGTEGAFLPCSFWLGQALMGATGSAAYGRLGSGSRRRVSTLQALDVVES